MSETIDEISDKEYLSFNARIEKLLLAQQWKMRVIAFFFGTVFFLTLVFTLRELNDFRFFEGLGRLISSIAGIYTAVVLLRFSSRLKRAIDNSQQTDLEEAVILFGKYWTGVLIVGIIGLINIIYTVYLIYSFAPPY